jgi:murein DD-endopeptidase MepM/ murein hydrolase activator NlpD
MSEPRTFKLTSPHMSGDDIKAWQREVRVQFEGMGIRYPLSADGDYGAGTRAATATLCHALGMTAAQVMADGVTPELRTRIRHRRLTAYERARMLKRVDYRRALRRRYGGPVGDGVALPVAKILADSWGYHPGVHDGLDVICAPDAPIHAMVRSRVIDVRSSGWWGKNPSGDVSKGDGIIQLEVIDDVGPFRRGMHIGYGHAEKACVKVGDIVKAGQMLGHAGYAVAWHVHLMVNDGSTTRGVGNIDPREYLDYCKANA